MTAALVYEVVVFAVALVMVPALPKTRAIRGTPASDVDAAAPVGPAA